MEGNLIRNIKVPREIFRNFLEAILTLVNHVQIVKLSSKFLLYFLLDQEVSILRWEERYEKIRRCTGISLLFGKL